MPRHNAARTAAPVRRKEQALLEEALPETDHRGAPDDNADQGVISNPASPTKSAMSEDTTKSGILGKAWGFFRLSRKSLLEEAQDAAPVEEAKEIARDQSGTLRTEGATALPTTLKPSDHSFAKSTKRKRPSDAERQNLYEVPAETSSYHTDSEEPPRPGKRVRQNVKAKTPLILPKPSKGRTTLQHPRQTRSNSTGEAERAETTPDVRPAASVNGNGASAIIEEPTRRKRGRPRKHKNPDPDTMQEAAIIIPENKVSADPAMLVSGVAAGRQCAVPQVEDNMNEGIFEILLNPSPIKVTREASRSTAPTAQQQKIPKTKNRAKANSQTDLSDDEDRLFVAENDEERRADDADNMEIDERTANKVRRIPFDPNLIEEMWEDSMHVGHKHDAIEGWLPNGHVERVMSAPGKRMIRELEILITNYEMLQETKMHGNKRASRDAHEAVERSLEILRVESRTVVTVRFGPDFDVSKKKVALTDIYFHVIPKWIYALKTAVTVYDIQGFMQIDALEEILNLIDLLYDLANVARAQPKEVQPRQKGGASYQISRPTQSILPRIRILQKKILIELNSQVRRAKQEQEQAERERRRVEEQEEQKREEAEIQRKRVERRRIQGESWWTVRNNHLPAQWNRALQAEIARLEAAGKGKGRQESVELGHPRIIRAESRRANSEESRHGVERVSVFPANNVKANSSMGSLSKEDTLVFINCMRYEQGADRYERAAEQICRSMDEVFAFAKEFQEAMDLQHQEGNFTEARDNWTYSVWVEQE